MSVVTALLVLVRQTVCYIIKGAQSPVGSELVAGGGGHGEHF